MVATLCLTQNGFLQVYHIWFRPKKVFPKEDTCYVFSKFAATGLLYLHKTHRTFVFYSEVQSFPLPFAFFISRFGISCGLVLYFLYLHVTILVFCILFLPFRADSYDYQFLVLALKKLFFIFMIILMALTRNFNFCSSVVSFFS